MSRLIVVKAAFDSEAGVWYIESSDLFGLHIEAATIEGLIRKLPGAVADLLEDDPEFVAAGGREVPIPHRTHDGSRRHGCRCLREYGKLVREAPLAADASSFRTVAAITTFGGVRFRRDF